MPLYELHVFRQRTVFDESTIKVRAHSLEAAQEADIEALDSDGTIRWNCDHYDETDDVYIEDVEELGDDEDDIEVDVDLGEGEVTP
jgi:hypothetical protein